MGREEEETGWSDDIFVTWKGLCTPEGGDRKQGVVVARWLLIRQDSELSASTPQDVVWRRTEKHKLWPGSWTLVPKKSGKKPAKNPRLRKLSLTLPPLALI